MSKTSSNNNNAVVVFTDLLGIVNHGYSLTWCKSIFAYLGPTAKETMALRSYCKLFSKALKPPCWTSFPHSKYSTLNGLVGRFNEVSSSGSTNVPKVLLIANGVHVIEDEYINVHGRKVNIVDITISISIVGESREHCIVMGGVLMKGKKEDDVNISNLTLRGTNGHGVQGKNGASIHLDNVSVENSRGDGVWVFGTKRSTMMNCNVSHSKQCGLVVGGGGLMTIDGNGTTIHHNCTHGNKGSSDRGLHTSSSSSSIHLASPLTKETISKNNGPWKGGRGNYGGPGTIKTL
jgi:ribosomal protein L18E